MYDLWCRSAVYKNWGVSRECTHPHYIHDSKSVVSHFMSGSLSGISPGFSTLKVANTSYMFWRQKWRSSSTASSPPSNIWIRINSSENLRKFQTSEGCLLARKWKFSGNWILTISRPYSPETSEPMKEKPIINSFINMQRFRNPFHSSPLHHICM
jgi:hypothetical protein